MRVPVWVILPTYNEALNLEGLVEAIAARLSEAAPSGFRILVVDDDSPDGTGEIADALAARLAEVEVLHRRVKDGLGKAVLAGFSHALEHGAELVVEMDADFSHDPVYLPALLAAAADHDVVLGSRYVDGGGVQDWDRLRRVLSRVGGIYARRVLGFAIQDPTGGYKCIRREVLESIDMPSIGSQGYVFMIEVTYRALLAGFSVHEVPIVFRDRRAGMSKMSMPIVLEAVWRVPGLRARRRRFEQPRAATAESAPG